MKIILNGEQLEVTSDIVLAEMLTQLDLPHRRIAVEINKEVVRRSEWASRKLGEADKIEVVHFVGGG